MEFPHGRHTHTHTRRNDDDDYPPPPSGPPPFFDQPPPPPFFRPPSPFFDQSNYREDELQPASVYHTSHETIPGPEDYPPPPPPAAEESEHHFRPHLPSFLHHHTQHEDSSKPTYKIYCKAHTSYSLTIIRDDALVLAPSDPKDPLQHWFKDEKYSTRVKDKDGFPGFALVNKATRLALKCPLSASHPVELTPYNADALDQSVLWTESKDQGDGYRVIRTVKDTHLNLDASDGTRIILGEWKKRDDQRFKITAY